MSDKGKKFSCTRPNQLPQPSGSNNLNKFSNKYHFLSVFLFHWFEFQFCMHTIQGAQISKSGRLGENICWLPLMCSSQTEVTFSLRLIMQTSDRLTGGHIMWHFNVFSGSSLWIYYSGYFKSQQHQNFWQKQRNILSLTKLNPKSVFGSDKSPRRGKVGSPSVRVLYAFKLCRSFQTVQLSWEGRGKGVGREASKHGSKQGSKQASREAGK